MINKDKDDAVFLVFSIVLVTFIVGSSLVVQAAFSYLGV